MKGTATVQRISRNIIEIFLLFRRLEGNGSTRRLLHTRRVVDEKAFRFLFPRTMSPRVNELGKPRLPKLCGNLAARRCAQCGIVNNKAADSPSLCHATGSLIQCLAREDAQPVSRALNKNANFLPIKLSRITVHRYSSRVEKSPSSSPTCLFFF